jgi:hypothetical protein
MQELFSMINLYELKIILKTMRNHKQSYWSTFRWDLCRMYDGGELEKRIKEEFNNFNEVLKKLESEVERLEKQ